MPATFLSGVVTVVVSKAGRAEKLESRCRTAGDSSPPYLAAANFVGANLAG